MRCRADQRPFERIASNCERESDLDDAEEDVKNPAPHRGKDNKRIKDSEDPVEPAIDWGL